MKKSNISYILSALILLSINGFAQAGRNHPKTKSNRDGYKSIFNGKTLAGWKGDQTYWRVENGNLVGEVTPETLWQQRY